MFLRSVGHPQLLRSYGYWKEKCAPYIAQLLKGEVEEFWPLKKNTIVFFFDRASNVQNAGQIIEAIMPGSCSLHGAEH